MLVYLKRGEDMIEIIYNDEKQEEKKNQPHFHLPKNIRQIGEIDKGKRIYIEDYAVTYINQYTSSNMAIPCVGILLGRINWLEGTQYIFISSVLSIRNIEVTGERISFGEDTWTSIYEESEKYFKNQEIVGWFLSVPGTSLEITDAITRAHTNHFAGNDKVFLMREAMEKDDAFFVFENGRLTKQDGYYIYYERNDAMQDYMVVQNGGKSVDKIEVISDKAIQNFRKILEEKKEENPPHRMMTFMYAASTFLIMTVLVIGITMINNYDKMKNMEKTLTSISDTVVADGQSVTVMNQGQGNKAEEDKLSTKVEKMEGEVEKIIESQGGETQAPETQAVETQAVETQAPETQVPQTQTPETQTPETQAPETQVPETKAPIQDEVQTAAGGKEQYYTIELGDTVAGISKKFYGTIDKVEEICVVNNLQDGNTIYPGQKILLP
jgi:LysM repeat protein